MTERDPLAELIVDEQEIAREELAQVLRPYVRFSRTGWPLFEKAFHQLTSLKRVCCVLLALRAMSLLDLRDRTGASNTDIAEITGMPQGTVNPKLSELKDQRLAVKEDGEWTIPTYALRRAMEMIEEGRE